MTAPRSYVAYRGYTIAQTDSGWAVANSAGSLMSGFTSLDDAIVWIDTESLSAVFNTCAETEA